MRSYYIVFPSLLLLVFLVPSIAGAIELNLDYPAFGPDGGFDLNNPAQQNLSGIIAFFYYFIVGIAGLAAFVMLIWGGVQWLLSGAIPSQASEAKEKIKNAILGILLILASVLIVQLINPELTVLSGVGFPAIDCDEFSEPLCDPLAAITPDGITAARLPTGATIDGVYLCRNVGCVCDNDPCIGGPFPAGSYDDDADYRVLPVTTYPPFAIRFDPFAVYVDNLGSWNGNVEAIAVRGDYGVLLGERNGILNVDGGQELDGAVVCFSNTTGGRLADFEMRSDVGQTWNQDGPRSLKILTQGTCEHPGITLGQLLVPPLPPEQLFWLKPRVFLFSDIDQGQTGVVGEDSFLRYRVPVRYVNSEGTLGAGIPIRSLHVIPGQDALRLFHPVLPDPPPPGGSQICFRNSVDDLRSYNWESGSDDSSTSVWFNTQSFQAITDEDCPVEREGVPEPFGS